MRKKKTAVDVNPWSGWAGPDYLSEERISLLQKIDELGAISKAAEALGVSYRTARQRIDDINSLAGTQLVTCFRGGGATLTRDGKNVIRKHRVIQEEHKKFLEKVNQRLAAPETAGPAEESSPIEVIGEPEALDPTEQTEVTGGTETLGTGEQTPSARVSTGNIFSGKVEKITLGGVNAEVYLRLHGGTIITAVVTKDAVDHLGLKEGSTAWAMVNASSLILGKGWVRANASNVLNGTISDIGTGAVNTRIELKLSGGDLVTAVITNESRDSLGFEIGDHAFAIFKGSSVILGVLPAEKTFSS